MSKTSRTILVIVLVVAALAAVTTMTFYKPTPKRTAPPEQLQQEQLQQNLEQELRKTGSSKVLQDIEQDFTQLEEEYNFGSDDDISNLDIPNLEQELNTEL